MTKADLKIDEISDDRPIALRFSPTAWAKLLFMRDAGDTEVGGFAVTPADDLLYVDDFFLPKQECTSVDVSFDDKDIGDYMDDMVDKGLLPKQFMRIWIHTHPNMDSSPSYKDEETFARVLGNCNWAIMAIISNVSEPYCRLQINEGPIEGSFLIPLEVDYDSYDFPASKSGKWLKEYKAKVTEVSFSQYHGPKRDNLDSSVDTDEDLDKMLSIMSIDEIPGEWPISDLDIDEEVLQHLTPHQLMLLEDMDESEREHAIDQIKTRFKIGD